MPSRSTLLRRQLSALVLLLASATATACTFTVQGETSTSAGASTSARTAEPVSAAAADVDPALEADGGGPPVEAMALTLASDAPPSGDAPGFSVHEWGLVAASASRRLAIGTSPVEGRVGPSHAGSGGGRVPPPDERVSAPGKPVFYVHLDPGVSEVRFALGVRSASRARVIEHYPPGVREERNTAVVWGDVLARSGSCRGSYPGLTDRLCQTSDGLCELAELANYETAEAACLSVADQRVGLLFYRMEGARDTLPLDVRRVARGGVQLRSVTAPPGGLVLRVHRDSSFAATRVRSVQLDADGRALVPGPDQEEGLLPARAGLDLLTRALDDAGLSVQERDAFLRAWRDALFGGGDEHVVPASVPVVSTHPLGPVADALLYFWPRAEVDAALPLTITPAPREVRRVFVVRVDLGGP